MNYEIWKEEVWDGIGPLPYVQYQTWLQENNVAQWMAEFGPAMFASWAELDAELEQLDKMTPEEWFYYLQDVKEDDDCFVGG